jgi:CubicO group peptidase (beta-lactamase class C family)
MNKLQFRVLHRQFLFRLFDLEVLSPKAEGDSSKLLGQLAGLLVFVSAGLAFGAILFDGPWANGLLRLVVNMIVQHFLIATTMLVVGLFAVLSWDGIFPDRRDLQVLGPLPVTPRTMFAAKISAVAAALGLTVFLLHSLMGLIWPLVFSARAEPTSFPALTLSPTSPPVAARDLQAVMDRDLQQALTTGELAPQTGLGLAIGVRKKGERRVFTYGAAKPDSIFEIGSISKTFTGLMLAQMVVQGKVRFDEPVRELLPAGTVTKPTDSEITLLDLATHHSGLPPMPDNMGRVNQVNSWADYGRKQLYAYMASHGVAKPVDATFIYSNLGVGLLGQALADRAGKNYAAQLRDETTSPLGMSDTVLKLSGEQQRRFLPGYDSNHRQLPTFDRNGALAGAGAILSTAGDMLTYLEANLRPEKSGPLSGALQLSHQLHERMNEGQQIALTWAYTADTGTYWHNGATSGFTCHAFFNPGMDSAVVVLINSGPNPLLSADSIAEHIRQRLSGEPAITLDNVLVPVSTGIRGVFRSFAAYWLTMLLAGVFAYGAVLTAQGLAAQLLPRRLFLRFSGYLQLAAVCVIIAAYFLQPGFYSPSDLLFGSASRLIRWLPSYWFLAVYQQLNGSMHPALQPLASRAWIGLAAVLCVTPVVYALSYWRMLSAIAEEPDITPAPPRWGFSGKGRLFRFGSRPRLAITQFGVRTLARSRQHRLILSFYLGIGLAFTSLLLKGVGPIANAATHSWREESMLLWAASILVMSLAIIGTRVAFAIPFDLKANWIFQVAGVRSGPNNLAGVRRTLYLVAVVPVWLVTAIVCLSLWPSRENAGHLVVLALTGIMLVDVCLLRFPKIPFTCSWLPGKSKMNMAFLAALGLLWGGREAADLERRALQDSRSTLLMLAILVFAAICVRRILVTLVSREKDELRFEEEPPPLLIGLELNHD